MKKLITLCFLSVIAAPANSQGFIPIKQCALLYAHSNFDQMAGKPHTWGVVILNEEESATRLMSSNNDFSNQVSAASVKRGCTLTLYDHSNFTGFLQQIKGPTMVTTANGSLIHDDRASAATCTCQPNFDDF